MLSWALAQESYLVRPGDTLFAIARAHGSSVEALMRLNGLTSSLITVGQSLRLPGPAAVLEPHEVAAGETLADLAGRYGVEEAALRRANPALAGALADAPLVPGLKLWVPLVPGEVVRLGPGDTLLAVALRYGLAPAELAAANGLDPGSRPEAVLVPAGAAVAAVAAVAEEAPAPAPTALPAADGAPARQRHLAAQLELLALAADNLSRYQPPAQSFAWPLSGRISSGYGQRNISVGGNTFHGGLDIAAEAGTPVRAARAGVVSRAEWGGAYGYVIYLEHGDGSQTRYGHLSRFLVGVGSVVAQGQAIGEVGSTGASTGPHLHFEIRFSGRSVDPLGYLPGGP